MRVYLAGPMTGYDKWNFPAFDEYAARLRATGKYVISPAELDRDAGFDENDERLPDNFMFDAMRRDIEALLQVDAVVLMPGWEKSKGVAIELAVAKALGLRIYEYPEGSDSYFPIWVDVDKPRETVLQEADRIVAGDRNADYGHPSDDFKRTGRIWGAILGIPDVPPEKVGLCMAGLKISREVNKHKRDNLTDLAGYAKTVAMVEERKAKCQSQSISAPDA